MAFEDECNGLFSTVMISAAYGVCCETSRGRTCALVIAAVSCSDKASVGMRHSDQTKRLE